MSYSVVIERTPNNYAAYVHTLTRRCAPPSPSGRGSEAKELTEIIVEGTDG